MSVKKWLAKKATALKVLINPMHLHRALEICKKDGIIFEIVQVPYTSKFQAQMNANGHIIRFSELYNSRDEAYNGIKDFVIAMAKS